MPAEEFLAAAVDEDFRLIFAGVWVNTGNKEGTKQSCGMKHYPDIDLSSIVLVLCSLTGLAVLIQISQSKKSSEFGELKTILPLKGRQTMNGLVGRFPPTTYLLGTFCWRTSLLAEYLASLQQFSYCYVVFLSLQVFQLPCDMTCLRKLE